MKAEPIDFSFVQSKPPVLTAPVVVHTPSNELPPSLFQVLAHRGYHTPEAIERFLQPRLEDLKSPDDFQQIGAAAGFLLEAIRGEKTVAIYADRDVDGLTGLAVLARSLRSLGAKVVWGSPVKERGVQADVLARLMESKPSVVVFVDCGTGEEAQLESLLLQGVHVIVADHHQLGLAANQAPVSTPDPSSGIARGTMSWVHPGMRHEASAEVPAGCVMAFKLAHALWRIFLGDHDAARLDYFLFDHVDLISLGILADRVPLTGENRTIVWHGLSRMARSRKTGMSLLTRFFRLTPRSSPITTYEANWRVIPLLNSGGRLGRPECTANLLITEDISEAHDCLDTLLELNSLRRQAQDKSLNAFDRAIQDQCALESDAVIVALAGDLEPTVTGLAAQSFVARYGRPTFLFVEGVGHVVGSGRGLPGVDLYAWIERHRDLVIRFGGHHGAVGLTVKTEHFPLLRDRLRAEAKNQCATMPVELASIPEGRMDLREINEFWWRQLQRLAPFGTGNPWPIFEVSGIESIEAVVRRQMKVAVKQERRTEPQRVVNLRAGEFMLTATLAENCPTATGPGPWSMIGFATDCRKSDGPFKWIIQKIWRTNG